MPDTVAPEPSCPPATTQPNDFMLNRMVSRRAYSAGNKWGSLSDWGSRSFTPFEELASDFEVLVSRVENAYRNNGWISRALDVSVSNDIGTGIHPQPTTGNKGLDSSLSELYRDVQHYLDPNEVLNTGGIQASLARGRLTSGDSFAIIHHLKPSRAKHLPVPLQLQPIDASFCPYDYNENYLANGNIVVHGVEVDPRGKSVAFYFYKQDPARPNFNKSFLDLLRVPADRVIHHFIPIRTGQVRAIPALIKGVPKAVMFDKYNDAELERKTVRASLTGTVEKAEITAEDHKYNPVTGDPLDYDHSILPSSKIESGTFLNMLAGETVNLFPTDDAGRGYPDFQKWQLLAFSASVNVPYELVSGDFAGINDRLWRAIFNNMKRQVEATQELYIIPQICRTTWMHIVDRAVLAGSITIPKSVSRFAKYRANHVPQMWEYIQPVQDVEAQGLEVSYGFRSRKSIIDAQNKELSIEELDAQRAIETQSEADKGLTNSLYEQPVEIADPNNPPPAQPAQGIK